MRQTSNRIPELDGIRGIAIAMVLVYHDFFLTTAFSPGSLAFRIQALGRLTWSGVDLFFVLSGFLIGGILLDSREAGDYFAAFYTRRCFRILPLYGLFLAGVYFFVHAAPQRVIDIYGWTLSDRHSFFPYVFFLQNFSMSADNYMSFLGITWSLAVEEQFYLVMPSVIRIFSGRKLLWLIVSGICAAPVIRMFISHVWPEHWFALYVLTPCRMDALLIGVLGAYLLRQDACRNFFQRRPRFLFYSFLVLLAGMGVLTKFCPAYTHRFMLTGGLAWIAFFYLSLILYAVTQPESRLAACLRWKPLRALGTIAYGVYLVHGYALAFLHGLWFSRPLQLFTTGSEFVCALASIALTFLVCRYLWLFFEKPMLLVGHQLYYGSAPATAAQPIRQTYVRPMVSVTYRRIGVA